MTTDLYELTDHAAGWRMPIRVRWHNEALAEVTFAEIPMLSNQRQAIISKLSLACSHFKATSESTGIWWIPKMSFNALDAVKSTETDPERIVRWAMPEPPMLADADFVNAYCKQESTPIRMTNPAVAIPVWSSFENFMFRWLVIEGRSLKLSFGRLDAFPVRANWKNAIIAGVFKLRNNSYKNKYLSGDREFFRSCITKNTEGLTAYDKTSNTMRWSVEFTPNKKFHAAVEKVEIERKENPSWKNNYLGQIIHALREPKTFERLYANLIAYSKETDFPFAIFPHGSSVSSPPKGFQPVRSNSSWYQVNLVTAAAAQGLDGSAVVPEDESVHALQNLQSAAQDLRDGGDSLAATRKDNP